MNKSSFLSGLMNNKPKNISEYLTGWDDLNILFKSMGKTWGFISGIWTSKSERKHHQTKSYIDKVNGYLDKTVNESKFNLHVILYKRFADIFDIEHGAISSQKELDDHFIDLESKIIDFQKKISHEKDKMKNFNGNTFADLRKYFLEIMIDQFKDLENTEQQKILEEMVNKLNSLSSEELNEFKKKMNINDITNESMKKILIGGGLYSMFAGTVGLVGFPAYIILTSLIGGISSFIGISLPFGVYTGATSMMAFLSSWFWPIILAGGLFFGNKYTNKLRKIFTVASMVSISFQSYKDTNIENINEFIKTYNLEFKD